MTGPSKSVLLVEDDEAIADMLREFFEGDGYRFLHALTGEEAVERLRMRPVSAILLDLNLPGMDGIETCRRIREATKTPVIMLTARDTEVDKVLGLEMGADDYVTKPFSARELIARIRAVLRRTTPTSSDEPVEVAGLRLDPVSHRVTANGRTAEMGPTEYRLLHFFMTHEDRVFTRGQLLDNVWGTNVYVEERTVDVHIRRLRLALAESGHDTLVQTIRGAGYRFSRQT